MGDHPRERVRIVQRDMAVPELHEALVEKLAELNGDGLAGGADPLGDEVVRELEVGSSIRMCAGYAGRREMVEKPHEALTEVAVAQDHAVVRDLLELNFE